MYICYMYIYIYILMYIVYIFLVLVIYILGSIIKVSVSMLIDVWLDGGSCCI